MSGAQYVNQLLASCSSPHPRESYVETGQKGIYYYPNMCHICHCFGENSITRKCSRCQLISYCSQEHQKKDWSEHRDFCKAVSEVKKDLKKENIFTVLRASNDPNKSISTIVLEARARVNFKAHLMWMIAQVLKRQLKPHEVQMIIHPNVCAVCFESKSELLTKCNKCPQASFCKEHLNDPSHKEVCLKLLTVFAIEDKGMQMQEMTGDIKNVKIAHQMKRVSLPSTMKTFLDIYVNELEMRDEITGEPSPIKIALTSERFSRSLSLLFAMEKLKYTPVSKILVHVIGATLEEIVISDWEIILHWLPQLSELKLVLIGPNILPDFEQKFSVCKLCKRYEKSFIVEAETMFYEEYSKKPNFKKPDIIAAFNAGIYAYPSWNKGVKVVASLGCPLLITSYNRIEAYREQNKISSMFGTAKCIYFQPNPFASMMYFRNPADESTCSKNDFMLVYKHLYSNA